MSDLIFPNIFTLTFPNVACSREALVFDDLDAAVAAGKGAGFGFHVLYQGVAVYRWSPVAGTVARHELTLHAERETAEPLPLGGFATREAAAEWVRHQDDDWLEGWVLVATSVSDGRCWLHLGDDNWEELT